MQAKHGPVRVAIVGVGVMGRDHLRNARAIEAETPGALEVVGLADVDTGRARGLAPHPDHPDRAPLPTFDTADALFAATHPDVAIIATPHPQHEEGALAAAAVGIHVLCEKPIAHTPASADRIVAACREAGVLLGIDFNQRLTPGYVKAREMIAHGTIGRVYRVNFVASAWYRTQQYYNSGGWRGTWAGEGGGVIMNQAPHHLDLYCWLAGIPNRIKAVARTRIHEIEVENTVAALLEHGDDRVDTFYTTTSEWPGRTEFLFRGTLGTLEVIDGRIRHYKMARSLDENLLEGAHGAAPAGEWHDVEVAPPARGLGQHKEMLRRFCDAARAGDPSRLVATGEDGVRALELGNAMYLASHHDATVTLPVDRRQYDAFLAEKVDEVARGGSRKRVGTVEYRGDAPPSV
jgi:predicted dehydrogenase